MAILAYTGHVELVVVEDETVALMLYTRMQAAACSMGKLT